ncbi:hypothetical protein BDN72DRAFT_945939, partial [Pluteus cervinus]
DHPFLDWIPLREEFLEAVLHLEDPDSELVCVHCLTRTQPSYYRCKECFDTRISCGACIVALHAGNPFHWIQKWNGSFFVCINLHSLHLKVQLGHPIGEKCGNPSDPSKTDFIILDVNGIQPVSIAFCECGKGPGRHIQLLHAQLFPATSKSPQTAATFRLLHTFQLQSFLSKVSPYEYYSTLRRLTDNTGETVPVLNDRYKQFLHMVREWRHLKLMKRAGRGYLANGIATATQGQCAVLCPACPHPGINLPPNYQDAPNSFLYRMFQAKDANFRMKRFNVSNATVDPCLNGGCAYLVNGKPYQDFLFKVNDNENVKEETSDCNNHDAIKSASSKGGKGVAITGIAAVECARHDMKRPTSVTTLQKGEKYIHMDYAFLSSLSQNAPSQIVESYDIACQWSKKLRVRVGEYSPWFTTDLLDSRNITYLVPKWHLAAHRDSCRTGFSFNFTPGVGRTDGEAPERGWAAINEIAASAKEMGPGSWSDTLDDYLGDYNWRKVIAMHGSLLTKLVDAVPERADHVLAFLAFSKAIAKTRLDLVQEWTSLVQVWETDNSKPNPFASTNRDTITLNDVRLKLAEEDSADIAKADAQSVVIHRDIPPSQLLSIALEIEVQQYKLAADSKALGAHSTPLQRTKIVERRNNLMRRISSWVEVQHLYIPALAAIRQEEGAGENPTAETYELYMPSSICKQVTVHPTLLDYEWRYRQAQAGATLDSLRGRLLMRGKMYKSKRQWSRGQGANTRSQKTMSTLQDKVKFDADKYRDIRSRLESLAAVLKKPGEWTATYRVLQPEDVKGIDEGGRRVTEGRRTLSWIWNHIGVADLQEAISDARTKALRIEWCKARARAHRWQEECQLIVEEMRRVKEFFQYEVKQWQERAVGAITGGHRAYALRQAEIRTRLYIRCTENWARVDEYLELGTGGPENGRICVEYEHEVEEDAEGEDEDVSNDEDDGWDGEV